MIAKILNNNLIEIYDLTQFDLYSIMHSGQVFRYFSDDQGYQVISGNNYAQLAVIGNKVVIKCNDAKYFYNYFDLQTDYNEIKNELNKYEKIRPAIQACGGIRILRGEFVEIVVSFIISANNNIKRFTKTLNLICEKFGTKLNNGMFSFPSLIQLEAITEQEFNILGCGYRSNYLIKAVKQLSLMNYNELSLLPNDQLDKQLRQITGVGPKVSACVMLFAFHRLDAFPIDTWITKSLQQLTETEKNEILSSQYAGVAQQYIFYYLQHLKEKEL